MKFPILCFLALALGLQACSSIPVAQRADKRAQLDQEAARIVAEMTEQKPEIGSQIEQSAGYFVSRISAATVAVVGGAQGIGVLVDRSTGDRSYMDVRRFDLGAGLGVRYFYVLMVIESPEKLAEVRSGWSYHGLAGDFTAGQHGSTIRSKIRDGMNVHIMTETGANLAATGRVVRLSVNRDLTDTGLSEISIPNTGFGIEDGRGDPERRWWDHRMPFLAQQVIDKGYDLPLPYGFKLAYVDVDQEQLLTNLYVGINGSEPIPLDWVDFTNARSISDSRQLIFDTWVFPFMNVFAILGSVDGVAPVDVLIDGNGFLGELGIDCSKPGNVVICNLLQDKDFVLPIRADFSGKNYGIGVNLAGGWKGFFFTLPMSWNYADMDGSNTSGAVFSVSPRAGRVINLGNRGNLAWYIGGSYLNSDLTVDGSYSLEEVDLTFDYIIDQKNKDEWAAVVGLNWDINRSWSVQAEYNGFVGSRESWMASVSWRF